MVGLVVAAFIYVTESLGSRMYPAGSVAGSAASGLDAATDRVPAALSRK